MSAEQPRRRDQVPPDGWVTELRAIFDLSDDATWDEVLTACAQTKRVADRTATEWHALLTARVGEEPPATKRERYLARRGADPQLRTAMTNARLIVNDWHACSTEEELVRWRQAQLALIEAAIAVGRDLERNAARAAAPEAKPDAI